MATRADVGTRLALSGRSPAVLALLAVLALAGTAAVAAAAGATIRPAAAAATAQGVVDRWRIRTPVRAVTVAISDPGTNVRLLASGRDGDEPVAVDARFRVGSITKTFVATVIMQLADERRLRLDDPLSRCVPARGCSWPGEQMAPRCSVRPQMSSLGPRGPASGVSVGSAAGRKSSKPR